MWCARGGRCGLGDARGNGGWALDRVLWHDIVIVVDATNSSVYENSQRPGRATLQVGDFGAGMSTRWPLIPRWRRERQNRGTT
jgi:hypothetical protein